MPTTTSERQRAVTDATVWIDLQRAGLVEHAFGLSLDFLAPDLVLEELGAQLAQAVRKLGLIEVELDGPGIGRLLELAGRHPRAGRRDLSALVIAEERRMLLLTGDKALRQAAETAGLEVHGTLWILNMMVDSGVLNGSRAAQALDTIVASGTWLPSRECGQMRRRWLQQGKDGHNR